MSFDLNRANPPEYSPIVAGTGVRFLLGILTTLFLIAVTGAIAVRAVRNYQPPGKFQDEKQGYCDFHNGIYFPSLAFSEGFSPYGLDYVMNYPVERQIPAFAPAVLILHWPLTWFDLRSAEILYYGLMILMLVVLARISLRAARWSRAWWLVAGVAGLLAASRAGYGTLFSGYFTFELAIGALLAVFAGDRTLVGGIGFALASIKPTTGIPLAIMMLARGQWRAVATGSAIIVVSSLMAVGWLMMCEGSAGFVEQFLAAQHEHRSDPNELPVNTWTRIDILAVIAKWIDWRPGDLLHVVTMLPLIAFPFLAVWLANSRSGPGNRETDQAGLSSAVILLAVLSTLYHHHYDLVILMPVVLAAAGGTCGWIRYPRVRWVIGLLCLIPMLNYATSNLVLGKFAFPPFWVQILTSVNGVLLGIALAMTTWMLLTRGRTGKSTALESSPNR